MGIGNFFSRLLTYPIGILSEKQMAAELLKKSDQISKQYGFIAQNSWSRWFRLISVSFGIIQLHTLSSI